MGLVEVTISGAILLLLAASMVEAVGQVGALGRAGGTDARLQMGLHESLISSLRFVPSSQEKPYFLSPE